MRRGAGDSAVCGQLLIPALGSSCPQETDSAEVKFMQKCGQMRVISCSFPKGQTKGKANCNEMRWDGRTGMTGGP